MNALSPKRLTVPTLVLALLFGLAVAKAQTTPAIAPDAQSVVDRMGTTLSTGAFSFRIHTIRQRVSAERLLLHVSHTIDVLVRRPDRLVMNVADGDGSVRIAYDGKNLIVYSRAANKYVSREASGTLEDVLREAAKRLDVDFPLADLLANDPAKAFLHDVALGRVIGTVIVDDVPCLHTLFMQPSGVELELWTENNEQAVPRRLIATYHSLPGDPRFIGLMSDWKLGLNPPDVEFAFRPPRDAIRVQPPN